MEKKKIKHSGRGTADVQIPCWARSKANDYSHSRLIITTKSYFELLDFYAGI